MQRELGISGLRESIQYISRRNFTSHTTSGAGSDLFFNNKDPLQGNENGEES